MTFHIGFTGTREGMTTEQQSTLDRVLYDIAEKRAIVFHHGGCCGADEEAVYLVVKSLTSVFDPVRDLTIECHQSTARMSLQGHKFPGWALHPPKPPLERNKDIVNASDIMIACPKEPLEVLRSGTWATIRYARKMQKPLYLILPDGTVKEERT